MLLKRRDFLKSLSLGAAAGAVAACGSGTDSSADVATPASEHAGHDTQAGVSAIESFPGPAGQAGQLDDLLYPPKAEPASPGRVREYTLVVQNKQIEVARGTVLDAWTYNGTVPGPIIRATEGDTLRITLRNDGTHPHSIHFHGIHPSGMDGAFEEVALGEEFVYEFTAEPFGIFPYHCHMPPLDQHIVRGLYGAMIIDPPEPRRDARELVMVMNGYDLNNDSENEVYTVNGIGNYYMQYPIQLQVNELVRVYLVNMTEFDLVNSMHIHANMFALYRSGTALFPHEVTDIVTLGQGERAILEFSYRYPGRYMFHAHQTEFAMLGWMGMFEVVDGGGQA